MSIHFIDSNNNIFQIYNFHIYDGFIIREDINIYKNVYVKKIGIVIKYVVLLLLVSVIILIYVDEYICRTIHMIEHIVIFLLMSIITLVCADEFMY